MTVTKLALVALTVLCLLGTPAQAYDAQAADPQAAGSWVEVLCPPIQTQQGSISFHEECLPIAEFALRQA